MATSAFGKEEGGKWPFRPYIQMLANNNVSAGKIITKMQFDIKAPEHLLKYVVAQGSITLDGVSLTVGSIVDATQIITVWLIPETLAKTNLSQKKPGDLINIEVDILAKYVERLISKGAIDGK